MKFTAGIISIAAFGENDHKFDEVLSTISGECGFERVMLVSVPAGPVRRRGMTPIGALLNIVDSDHERIGGAVSRAGLEPKVIYAAGVNVESQRAARKSVEWLRGMAQVAVELDCHFLAHGCNRVVEPGMKLSAKENDLLRLTEIVNEVAVEFPTVRFAVDVHYHAVVESVADCEYYIEHLAVSNAGVMVNTGHLTTGGQAGWELLEKYPERTPIIGWKDHVPGDGEQTYRSVELGTGNTPLEKYAAAAKPQTVDRAHCITVEHAPVEQRVAALRASREYMENLWDNA